MTFMKPWTSHIPVIRERAKNTKTLDLCCGKNKYEGSIGIDKNPTCEADIICDLDSLPYPFKDEIFETVICFNSLEHLKDTFGVMGEIHRICKQGALVFIVAPHFSSDGSFIDPTHIHHFSARSWDYLIEGTNLFNEYGFYTTYRFSLRYRRIMLHRFFKFSEGFINRHVALYEEVLCYILRGKGIYMELEVIK